MALKYDPKYDEGIIPLNPNFSTRGKAQKKEEIEGEKIAGFGTENPYADKNLDLNDLFYNNEEVISSIRKYYFDRNGVANTQDVKDLVNEFRTDMRWMETNEVSAATTLFYLNNTTQEAVNNFRNAYDAFKAMPKFYAEGTVDETTKERAFRFGEGVFDYVAATVASPTGVLSLFTGGAGTAAKQAASRALMTKAVDRLSRKKVYDKLKRKGMLAGASKSAIVDLVGGVATNTATQFTRQRIGAQDDFSFAELGLVSAASAIPGGLMGAYTGRRGVTTTRETMDILEEGFEALGGAALREYSGKAGKVLAQKETKVVAEKLTKEFDEFQDSMDNPVTKPLKRKKTKDPLDPEIVAEGEQILKSVADDLGIESKGGKFSLAPEVMERIAGAARTVLKESGQKFNPNQRVSEQVFTMLRDRKIPFEVYRDVIDEFGITIDDFSKVVLMQASEYGRGLGSLSTIREDYLSSIRGIADSIRASYQKSEFELSMDAMRKISKKTGRLDSKFWARVNNARKGLLVSQPATAVRNAISVGAFQAAPDVLLTGFERIVANLEGRPMGGDYSDVLILSKHLFNIGLGSKKENLYIAQILRDLPKQQDRLFGHLFGDIANDVNAEVGEGTFSKLGRGTEDLIKTINFLNRGQEQLYRSAAFLAHIERSLARSGEKGFATLDELAKKGAIRSNEKGIITDDMVSRAVDFALEFTFANNPPKTDAFGRFGNDIIRWINNTPASIAVPFPRFMFAAMRYQYEFSPAGFVHTAGKGLLRKARGKGFFDATDDIKKLKRKGVTVDPKAYYQKEVRDLGKGIYGSFMLGGAYMLKTSAYGEDTKWYELKYDLNKPDEVIDTRALFPLPQYLFVADFIHRLAEGRPQDRNQIIRDGLTSFTGTNFRPGNVGSDIVDAAFDLFDASVDVKDTVAMNKLYGNFLDLAGNVLTQYMQPFNAINDVLMQYDIDEPFAKDLLGTGRTGFNKDRITSRLASRIAARLPAGVGNALYEDFYNEERKYTIDPTLPLNERVKRYNPLLKQFFGLTVGKSSLVQRTLEYYGLNYSDYRFLGGDAEVQRQLNHNLQKIINLHMPAMFFDRRGEFNNLVTMADERAKATKTRPNYIKVKTYLTKALQNYRQTARELLEAENPALRKLQKEMKAYSADERREYDYMYGSGAYEEYLNTLARQAKRTQTKDMKMDRSEEKVLGFTKRKSGKGLKYDPKYDEGITPLNPNRYK
tara:strand:+ start:3268 stop:6930 length:3663 start_codon:yes stop_codon:yes gene_type:complete